MWLRYKIAFLAVLSVAIMSLLNTLPVSALSNVNGVVELDGVANDGETYGSLKMNLKKTGESKIYTTTQTSMFKTVASTIGGTTNIYLSYIFKNVADGTYTSCIDGSEMCSPDYTIDSSNIQAHPLSIGGFGIISDYPKERLADILKLSKFVPGVEQATNEITTTPTTTTPTPTSSCTLKGMGWIVCPVMNLVASIADSSYTIVQEMMITPNLNINTDSSNSTYQAWGIMRSIANIAFVIAFLIIIFSQLTSVGITNYGVKKMLPRLIIAVILVNISYFLCAILVDISNIGGISFKQLFDNVAGQVAAPVISTGSGWVVIVGSVIGAATIEYASLAVLIPGLTAAVLAIVTVFLVLTLRQALIILLIVISPIAFVTFLLPNTEDLFKKWRSLFTTLLLMFPIISIIFGASALASKVVMGNGPSFTVQIMGALIAVIPLFLTPIIMKSAGGLLGKVGGVITNSGIMKGASGAANKFSEDYQKRRDSRLGNEAMNNPPSWKNPFRSVRRKSIERAARTEAIDKTQQGELNRARIGYIADATAANTQSAAQRALSAITGGRRGGQGLQTQMAAGGGPGALNRALANARTVSSKLDDEEVAAAGVNLDSMNFGGVPLSQNQRIQIATGQNLTDSSGTVLAAAGTFDEHSRRAAIQRVVKQGNVSDAHQLLDASTGMTSSERLTLSASLAGSSVANKAPYLSGSTLEAINQSGITSNQAALSALTKGKITAETLAGADDATINKLISVAMTTPAGSDERNNLREAYNQFSSSSSARLREKVTTGSPHDQAIQDIVLRGV